MFKRVSQIVTGSERHVVFKMPAILIVLFAALLAAQSHGPQAIDDRPMSLCELLRDRHQYRNQMVKVHGLLLESMHGSMLYDPNCPVPCFEWKGIKYPCGLELVPPKRSWDGVDFTFDESGYDALRKELQRRKGPLEVIYEGKFEAVPDSDLVVVYESGHPKVFGFDGRSLSEPVQFVIKSVALASQVSLQ